MDRESVILRLPLLLLVAPLLANAQFNHSPQQQVGVALRTIAPLCNYTEYINGGVKDLFYEASNFPGHCWAPQRTLRKQGCCNCVVIERQELCRPGAAAPGEWPAAVTLTNMDGLVRLNLQVQNDKTYVFCCNKTWFDQQHHYLDYWTRDLTDAAAAEAGPISQNGGLLQVETRNVHTQRDQFNAVPPVRPTFPPLPPAIQQRPAQTPAPVQLTAAQLSCSDAHVSCAAWAANGYCNTNIWAWKNCARSCSSCHGGLPSDVNSRSPPKVLSAVDGFKSTSSSLQKNFVQPTINSQNNALRVSTSHGASATAHCRSGSRPANQCLVGTQPARLRWFFSEEHHECLAFWDRSCANDGGRLNRHNTHAQCTQLCKAADAPTCAANGAPAQRQGRPVDCQTDSQCPAGHTCRRGAFFGSCCDASREAVYQQSYNPDCGPGRHLERFEDHGRLQTLLGATCADSLCSPASQCVQRGGDLFAYCCSSIRLAPRRPDENVHILL